MIRTTCKVNFFVSEDTLTVSLTGEIDHHAAARVREEIDAQIYRTRPKRTLLDLSGIEFMDSSGLGLIMGRIALMRKLGGETVLYHPTEKVLRIVRLSGLERMMKIETEEA
ncbi:MAG: anti-sigma factor antagonist [Clostridia bacterium]|nr:anti-sigma factor antagonist [Clostridia bacterium]